MMWKALRNMILPPAYVKRIQMFKQADRANEDVYLYQKITYRITARQRNCILLYHVLPPIIIAIAIAVAGRFPFVADAWRLPCQLLFGAGVACLSVRIPLYLFVREADKNVLSNSLVS